MEKKRKIVHISMIVFALLIGHVPAAIISATCLAALIFNIYLLPVVTSRSLEKKEDQLLGYSPGLIIYPGILLLISIIFYRQQIFLLIGWSSMAFGDGFAGLLGRKWGKHSIFWNHKKTWEGLFFFLLFAVSLSMIMLILQPESLRLEKDWEHWLTVIILSNIFAAVWESIPDTIDDNFVVPLASAVSAYYIHEILIYGYGTEAAFNHWYFLLAVVFGLGSLLTGKITYVGALLGTLITLVLIQAFSWYGLLSIGLFFVLGTAVSVWKKSEKQELGLAEANQGKRGYANVLANASNAFFLSLLAIFLPGRQEAFEIMMTASFAAALSDTVSSELGNIFGKNFISILTLRKGKRGEDGMISLEGTFYGFIGSALMGGVYLLLKGQVVPALVITLAGFFGNLMDSILGCSLQKRGFLNNHTVNFFNTLLAALLAGILVAE